MIKVTIELMSAITGQTSTLGTMYIANDGSGTKDRGDYLVGVCRKGSATPPRELYRGDVNLPNAARAGSVKNYPRLSYNVWRLVSRALIAAFPEERESKGIKSLLRAPVVRGFGKFMLDAINAKGAQPGKSVEEVLTPDELAALEWVQGGLADD